MPLDRPRRMITSWRITLQMSGATRVHQHHRKSGRRPKNKVGIIRLGFKDEPLITVQHLATIAPR